jgi:Ca-activated chloride channel homolog
MNRTTLIFSLAATLVVAALAFGVKDFATGLPTPEPEHPRPIPVTPPEPDVRPDRPVVGWTPGTDSCAAGAADAKGTAALEIGTFGASLSQSQILHRSGDEVFAAFEIATEDVVLEDRPPLNLALVIDRSGSMRGAPMNQARQAARGLVERLGPQDRVAVVTYDTGAEVVMASTPVTAQGRARLLAAIDGIQARGMTNIHDGLVLGYEELTRGLSRGAISRLVHLSDGQANSGITDTPSLVRLAAEASARGIRSTSVGLGVHYNEHLMEALAEAGRGQYYYVRDGGNLDAIFAGELRNIQATVATNVELRLIPCDGVQVEEIYGLTSRREGDATVVTLADIAGGERRRVIARLTVPAEKAGDRQILSATFRYEDVKAAGPREAKVALAAGITRSAGAAEASVDRDVMAQVIEVQSAVALRTATAHFNRGDRQQAARHLEQEQRRLADRAQRYQVQAAPAARRSQGTMGRFRDMFGASADALAGSEARDVALEAQVEARAMERTLVD